MVMGQASDPMTGDTDSPLSVSTSTHLLNLLELSKSDLTTFTGGEELPVTEMLRDTILSVLEGLRPDLMAHSQRVAFLCHGIARQCGWTSRKINTLVTDALLHEIGSVIVPPEYSFWDLTSTETEDLSRRVSVDLLAACHADSELLEILTLSQNFRYRKPLPTESEAPTPAHVILGAAAFNFANLFDAVRHQKEGEHDVAEIIAALKTLAEIPEEHRMLESLEEWLSGRDQQIEQFDITQLQQQDLGMDEETLSIVHGTFLEILFELHDLEEKYHGFFILDATGRFLLWNYGCQRRLGYTMREMRNKHWTNQLMGYCNDEGLAFSDSQTPLYQTLETAKPAHLALCLKDFQDNLIETNVNSIPIMGRDGLLLGIVEVHRELAEQQNDSDPELILTPEWIGDLVDTIHNLDDNAEPIAEVPELDDSFLKSIEGQLGITGIIAPPQLGHSVEAMIEKAAEAVSNDSGEIDIDAAMAAPAEESGDDIDAPEVNEFIETDVVEDSVKENLESQGNSSEEETSLETEELASESLSEEMSGEESPALEEATESTPPDNLDELFSRFDSLVSESSDVDEAESEAVEQEEHAEAELEPSLDEESDNFADDAAPNVESFEQELSDLAESDTQQPLLENADQLTAADQSSQEDESLEIADSDLEMSAESDVELIEEAAEEEFSLEEQTVSEEEPESEMTEAVADEEPREETPISEPLAEVPLQEDALESTVPDEVSDEELVEQWDSEEPATEEHVEEELSTTVDHVDEEVPVAEEDDEVELAQETPEESQQEAPVSQSEQVETPEVPATIELPEETPTLDTQEVPSPDPGQTDPLAQPVSRKEWDAFVEHLIDPKSPDHEMVAVLFLDVDHFKAINDGFGHQIGTDLLTEISRRLSQACGKRELSCRYGGGQFAIACPGMTLEKARKRGDQFRKLIDRTRFDVLPFHSLTVSVGITAQEDGDDLQKIMNRAEHGLYQAKQSGRNCSVGVSSAEIEAEMKVVEQNMSKLVTGDFDVETYFEAMVASDMIVYKLGGFLYDMHAKLLHVDRRHVSMRVGKKGLIPYWGRQDDDRPVIIDLELAEGWNNQRSDKGLLANTRINVKIRPDGWVRSQETFLKRAHFVLRELKGYFVTN